MHTFFLVFSKNTFMMNRPSPLDSKSSQKLFINVTKIAYTMIHNIRLTFFNTVKALILSQAKHLPNLKMYMSVSLVEHLLSHHILNMISEMDMLFHKNHLFIINMKSANFLENKIGLAQYIQT